MSPSEKQDVEIFHSLIKSLKPSIHFTAKTEEDGWFFMHLCMSKRQLMNTSGNVGKNLKMDKCVHFGAPLGTVHSIESHKINTQL